MPANPWVVGIDLGATKMALGLVDPMDNIVARARLPTQAEAGPDAAVERLAQAVVSLKAHLPAGQSVAAVGVDAPGPIDHTAGLIVDPPNLPGWRRVPFAQMLSRRLGLPVVLEHDAKAAALGEFHYGAGRDARDMVYVVVGTGVGGGLILDGQLYRGRQNAAGEMGHITLDRQGAVCSCGSRGCVETYVSGPWLARRLEQLLVEHGETAAHLKQLLTGETVSALAAQGHPMARQVLQEAGDALGTAVATVAMILDVGLFVIGGSVAQAGDLLLAPARQAVPRHAFASVAERVRIVPAALNEDGPLLGCAWLARSFLQGAGNGI